ncbi:multidrug efflux pump [Rhodothalassium salexigens DSM 2132]|uniref:Multidrug efflux pump n=1 Tax=Rhodothalassium salexigens DSM 2132 TaxID=1188247 RepID=A0A4R2PBY1_RHOSA|nr:efflux RND transporter permease subunit [Rhodothalassium salexigens]MBB4212312.1 multidrug efflux pump [Rhodothalassium salexigens DSM 2132]MBK1638812.1 multidrug transporter AcrB [Rhodothalassium salexigens DSM 2132]TCP32537.1 multidrug efflux pump [Rhodothalassium salexigens DSM 2132]
MVLSDVAVKRPVFATVISLILVAFGIISFQRLPLREIPDIDPPIVSVDTDYPGASAAVIETRVTQIIEDRIAGVEGIRTITSSSQDGSSRITIEFELYRDIDSAANDVRDRVSRVLDNLPEEADPPEVSKVDSDTRPIMWFALSSPVMDSLQLSDYADRNLVDQISVVDGVARVRIGGDKRYAMRIDLDRKAMAARDITVADIEAALRRENLELPGGEVQSTRRDFTVRIDREYRDPEDFSQLVLRRNPDGHLTRLGEVATVALGAENEETEFRGNGQNRIGLGVVRQSTSNTLAVAEAVHAKIEEMRKTLPESMTLDVSYDSSLFISQAIEEVYVTLGVAMVLVFVVLYLFLGSIRTVIIPAVTVPVCIVATFSVLYLFGLTINLLTLLGLVLAIGLVVDDAIVVLENIYRRVEEGSPRLLAAYEGARQVGFAVIATTLVLIGVFLPIPFLAGNIGRLFSELAITLSAAVAFSSLVALTLTPMLSSKLLRQNQGHTKPLVNRLVDSAFRGLQRAYARSLDYFFVRKWLVGVVYGGALVAIAGLYVSVPQELAPREDRGAFFIAVTGPEGAGFEYMKEYIGKIEDRTLYLATETEEARVVIVRADGNNEAFGIVTLQPWDERARSADEIINELRGKYSDLAGVRTFIIMRQGISASGGRQPVQFVIGGDTYDDLQRYASVIEAEAPKLASLVGIDTDYKETQPQVRVAVNLDRAAELGVSVQTVGRTLETVLGGRRVTTFIQNGEEYEVILRAQDADRDQPSDILNYYVRSDRTGELVPLSNVVEVREQAGSATLNRFNRVRALTVTANVAPGFTLGQALDDLEDLVRAELPEVTTIDYKGESREYREAGGAIFFVFGMALLIVFLILAGQFESFIHPLVIMLTVPLAIAGGLLGLYAAGSTLNIYSQVALVILIGIAAKNGILIVEFANQMRDEGKAIRDALVEACLLRLRPIIMTSLSTAMGAVPLIMASGAGAASRTTIGVTIFWGVVVATFFTLFVVPVFYDLLARFTKSPGYEAQRLRQQQCQAGSGAADGDQGGGAAQPAE